MKTASEWINELALEKHPEGGFYKRTGASNEWIDRNGSQRPLYTSILFLLNPESPSHFHRLQSDEIWYYHEGAALTVHCLDPDGSYYEVEIGKDSAKGQQLQFIVPKGTIFGSSVQSDYALVGCMVSPGFDFEDFELFTQAELLLQYPEQKEIIERLAYVELP